MQRKLSNNEMLYGGGVGEDNSVKGALDFPDDEVKADTVSHK